MASFSLKKDLFSLLDLHKLLEKRLRVLRSTDIIFALDREMRYPVDIFLDGLPDLSVDLCPAFALGQPRPRLGGIEARLLGGSDERVVAGDIPGALEVGLEELGHDPVLHLVALRLAQLDQPVRVPRVAGLARKGEVDALLRADGCEARVHGLQPIRPEALRHPLIQRDADLWRSRVEVERRPRNRERVVLASRYNLFVNLNGLVELLLADVALAVVLVLGYGGDLWYNAPMGRLCLTRS